MAFGNIPDDINIELLLSYFPEGSLKVAMRGLHKRNAYNDIVDTEEKKDGTVVVGVGRNSLYNALPEYRKNDSPKSMKSRSERKNRLLASFYQLICRC